MGSAPGAGVHVRSYARLPSLLCEEKSSRVKKHRHIYVYIYSLGTYVYTMTIIRYFSSSAFFVSGLNVSIASTSSLCSQSPAVIVQAH